MKYLGLLGFLPIIICISYSIGNSLDYYDHGLLKILKGLGILIIALSLFVGFFIGIFTLISLISQTL